MITSIPLYKCDMKVNSAKKRKLGRLVQDKYKCFDVMIDCWIYCQTFEFFALGLTVDQIILLTYEIFKQIQEQFFVLLE